MCSDWISERFNPSGPSRVLPPNLFPLACVVPGDAKGRPPMTMFLRDLRFAFRMLAKSPGFTLVAVLTLAVGLGAPTVAFSWIRGLVIEPLPGVADQGRILMLSGLNRAGDSRSLSAPDARDTAPGAPTRHITASHTDALS